MESAFKNIKYHRLYSNLSSLFSFMFQVDDYVLVKLQQWFYVAKVLEIDAEDDVKVSYMRRRSQHSSDAFIFPNAEDQDFIGKQDVVGILRIVKGPTTNRLARIVMINPPLHCFNIR